MDYRVYHLCLHEQAVCIAKAMGLSMVIAYLFYQHWLGIALMPAIYFFFKEESNPGWTGSSSGEDSNTVFRCAPYSKRVPSCRIFYGKCMERSLL